MEGLSIKGRPRAPSYNNNNNNSNNNSNNDLTAENRRAVPVNVDTLTQQTLKRLPSGEFTNNPITTPNANSALPISRRLPPQKSLPAVNARGSPPGTPVQRMPLGNMGQGTSGTKGGRKRTRKQHTVRKRRQQSRRRKQRR